MDFPTRSCRASWSLSKWHRGRQGLRISLRSATGVGIQRSRTLRMAGSSGPFAPLAACRLGSIRPRCRRRFVRNEKPGTCLALFSAEPETWSNYTVGFWSTLRRIMTARAKSASFVDLIIDEAKNVTERQPIVLCLKRSRGDFKRRSPYRHGRNVSLRDSDGCPDMRSDLQLIQCSVQRPYRSSRSAGRRSRSLNSRDNRH